MMAKRKVPLTQLPAPLEEEECKWLMDWADARRWRGYKISQLLIRVPNGAYHGRDRKAAAVTARKLREQGMQAGVFDYILAVPTRSFKPHLPAVTLDCPGLWLEMKRIRGGSVSEEQHLFMAIMQALGWRCEIARGWVEASTIINKYLAEWE